MILSELLTVMADINRREALEAIAEGWFPESGPADFVFGMNSAFYFGARGDPERKAAVVRLAARYRNETDPPPNLFVQESHSARIGSGSDIERILLTSRDDDPTVGDLKEEYADPRRNLSFTIRHMDDAGRANVPTSSYFSCLADGETYPSAGVVQRHDNYERIAQDPNRFAEAFVASCAALKCFYAVGGFSLLTTSYNSYKSVRNYPIFKRFPGLLYWNNWMAAPEDDRSDDWVLDANWLTAIDDSMLEKIGGYETAREALGPEVVLHRFEGGIVFQAGPQPRIGDANIGDFPEAYRAVTRLLLPLRHPDWDAMTYIRAPEPTDKRDATREWIGRFD